MGGSTLEKRSIGQVSIDLPRDDAAPACARSAVDGLEHTLDPEREYALKLLISELVTNSVKYGGEGPVRVELQSVGGGVRVEVIDVGPGFTPRRRERDLDDEGGWGLVLVEQLSTRWGSLVGSSHLWFEIEP